MGQTMTTIGHSWPHLKYLLPPPGWTEPVNLTTATLTVARHTFRTSESEEQREAALARWTELALAAAHSATDLASAFSAHCNAPEGTVAEVVALETWHKFSCELVDQVADKQQAVALLRQVLPPLEEIARTRLINWLAQQIYHR